MIRQEETIVAPATAAGGALAVIRLSGSGALAVCDRIFRGNAPLSTAPGYTVHYGRIVDGERIVDDVLVSVFRAPRSYTGEDAAEISCHGSAYIVSEILRLAQAAGARMAQPGEFTVRAYLAGKLDLAQAEAVADLIASSSRAAHTLATEQMRGGYSAALEQLREKLLHLTSLLELELDFSEEDVEFADREQLRSTLEEIGQEIDTLKRSFSLGNALKEGVAVAIAGAPNAGKSTLLNSLLHDDRALVSDIAGTTRDVIEEQINIDGVLFRFLDTAGIRATDDKIERMGIERTRACIARARIVIHLVDATTVGDRIPAPDFPLRDDQTLLTVINKIDAAPGFALTVGSAETPARPPIGSVEPAHPGTLATDTAVEISTVSAGNSAASTRSDKPYPDNAEIPVGAPTTLSARSPETPTENTETSAGTGETIKISTASTTTSTADNDPAPTSIFAISALSGQRVDSLCRALRNAVDTEGLFHGDAIVSNSRHFQALAEARTAVDRAAEGFRTGLPTDLLAEEIRCVARALSTITGRGAIIPDEILSNIFSKFCIGK